MKYKYPFVILIVLLFSCENNENRKKAVFYGSDYSSDFQTNSSTINTTIVGDCFDESGEIISVPFEEKYGVKYIDVSVNGFNFEMIFDTGCSSTLISVAEANYLYQKGYLKDSDILGSTKSQIADGSIVENMVINLKEVIIANRIFCKDVVATVSSNSNAPLLLGNEILNRAASYIVDNENKVINFKLK